MSRREVRYSILSIITFLAVGMATPAQAEDALEPILELNSTLELPVEIPEILFDPAIATKRLTTKAANRLRKKTFQMASRVRRSKKVSTDMIFRTFVNFIHLSRHEYFKDRKNYLANDRFEEYGQQIVNLSEILSKWEKNPADRARAVYHKQKTKFLLKVLIMDNMGDLRQVLNSLDKDIRPRALNPKKFSPPVGWKTSVP